MNRKKKDKKSKVESSDEEDNVYTAERLLRKRVVRNQVQYLVKWLNWSDAYNSWEPEDNILDERLIDEFNRRNEINKKAIKEEKNKSKLLKLSKKLNQISVKNEKSTKLIEDKKSISENESDNEIIDNKNTKNIQNDLKLNESTSAIKNNSSQLNKSIELNKKIENNDKIVSELIEISNEEDLDKINKEHDDLVITASELVKINKNVRLINKPSSTITSNSLLVNQETINLDDNSNDDLEKKSNKIQKLDNQISLLKSTQSINQIPVNTKLKNQSISTAKKIHSFKPNQNLINISSDESYFKESNDLSDCLNNSLDDLSFNVINLTNNLSNSINLINNANLNSNLSGNIIHSNTLSSPSSSSSNYNLNKNTYHNIKNINIVSPIISSVNNNNHRTINSPYFINQRKSPIQTVKPINSLLNKSSNRTQNILDTNNQFNKINHNYDYNQTTNQLDQLERLDQQANFQINNHNLLEQETKLTTFQETSEAILNSKRLIKHHLPPSIFWKNNNLVNQIVITDVLDKDNISITIRESSSLNFFNRNSKKKKLKHLKKIKNNLI